MPAAGTATDPVSAEPEVRRAERRALSMSSTVSTGMASDRARYDLSAPTSCPVISFRVVSYPIGRQVVEESGREGHAATAGRRRVGVADAHDEHDGLPVMELRQPPELGVQPL